MMISEARVTDMVLRSISADAKMGMAAYLDKVSEDEFRVFRSTEEVRRIFSSSLSTLTDDDNFYLRRYTGYNYRNINNLLRFKWNHQVNGRNDENALNMAREDAEKISSAINKFAMPSVNFVTFRGTTLAPFLGYGVNELSQLAGLKGRYLYEQGFTSTSILRDTSYFGKDVGDGENYNVEIRYLISPECNGALLIDSDRSYSTNQNEFLLDKGSLVKVIDVKVDESVGTATLIVVLIPKKIWELTDQKSRNGMGK